MKDIYLVVPAGISVLAAADSFQRAAEVMAGLPPGTCEVINLDLLEGDE